EGDVEGRRAAARSTEKGVEQVDAPVDAGSHIVAAVEIGERGAGGADFGVQQEAGGSKRSDERETADIEGGKFPNLELISEGGGESELRYFESSRLGTAIEAVAGVAGTDFEQKIRIEDVGVAKSGAVIGLVARSEGIAGRDIVEEVGRRVGLHVVGVAGEEMITFAEIVVGAALVGVEIVGQ